MCCVDSRVFVCSVKLCVSFGVQGCHEEVEESTHKDTEGGTCDFVAETTILTWLLDIQRFTWGVQDN